MIMKILSKSSHTQSRTSIGNITLFSLPFLENPTFASIFGSNTLIHESNNSIATSSDTSRISFREMANLKAFVSFDSTR